MLLEQKRKILTILSNQEPSKLKKYSDLIPSFAGMGVEKEHGAIHYCYSKPNQPTAINNSTLFFLRQSTNPTVFQTNRLTDCNHTIFLRYIHQIQEHYLSFSLLMHPRLPLFQRVLHLIACLQILILTRCHARLLSTVESISLKRHGTSRIYVLAFYYCGSLFNTHTQTILK
jgi:hypothetical protein